VRQVNLEKMILEAVPPALIQQLNRIAESTVLRGSTILSSISYQHICPQARIQA
jgi:hypothetical protein